MGGANEPSLQSVLNAFALQVNVGDDNPSTNVIRRSAAEQKLARLGDEITAPLFAKATPDSEVWPTCCLQSFSSLSCISNCKCTRTYDYICRCKSTSRAEFRLMTRNPYMTLHHMFTPRSVSRLLFDVRSGHSDAALRLRSDGNRSGGDRRLVLCGRRLQHEDPLHHLQHSVFQRPAPLRGSIYISHSNSVIELF